jgi:iron complex outermembrane receptor protein
MLGVPSKTFSLNSSYYAPHWSATVTAMRAFDWIGYDRARLIAQPTPPTDVALREYWLNYNGFTHLRATLTRDILQGVGIMLTGDNLLGHQLGEPDNLTVVPGRTVSVGLKATF